MMKNTTNYGKIIAITLSVITCACAIAFVVYRLFRNLIQFCHTYQVPEQEELDFNELEECDDELIEEVLEEPEAEEAEIVAE